MPATDHASRRSAASEDAALVVRTQTGDEAAFAQIFRRHQLPLLSFCRHMLGSQDDAEDALQSTFIRAHRALLRDTAPRELRPWLYAIARNCCLSAIAKRRATATLEDFEPAIDGLSDRVQAREDLRELVVDLGRLPEDQRAALLLAELEDLPHHEIAAVVGCPVNKVKALIYQARASLIADRDARGQDCARVREDLAVASGGALRRGPLRRHLRLCEGCRSFQQAVALQRGSLALVLPAVPSAALAAKLLGGGGVGGLLHGVGAGAAAGAGGAGAGGAAAGVGVGVGAASATTAVAGSASAAGAGGGGLGMGALAAGGALKAVVLGAVVSAAAVGAAVVPHHSHQRAVRVHRVAESRGVVSAAGAPASTSAASAAATSASALQGPGRASTRRSGLAPVPAATRRAGARAPAAGGPGKGRSRAGSGRGNAGPAPRAGSSLRSGSWLRSAASQRARRLGRRRPHRPHRPRGRRKLPRHTAGRRHRRKAPVVAVPRPTPRSAPSPAPMRQRRTVPVAARPPAPASSAPRQTPRTPGAAPGPTGSSRGTPPPRRTTTPPKPTAGPTPAATTTPKVRSTPPTAPRAPRLAPNTGAPGAGAGPRSGSGQAKRNPQAANIA